MFAIDFIYTEHVLHVDSFGHGTFRISEFLINVILYTFFFLPKLFWSLKNLRFHLLCYLRTRAENGSEMRLI
jgi:hypothetical protein